MLSWHECKKKTPPTKKNLSKKKKLKIGVKLKKNLDKNKFGLDKKKSYCSDKKVYCLSIKKYCLSTKKRWSGEEKTELCPTQPSTYTTIIPHTQHNNNKKGRGTKNHVPTH